MMSPSRTNKDPNKPKGLTTAYAYFMQHHRAEIRKTDPARKVILNEFSKECGQLWKIMTVEEKKPFQDLANVDKMRHVDEMKDYAPEKKKKRGPVDPNKPKAPLSPFFWFCADFRPIIKQGSPQIKLTEVSKILGGRWRLMTLDQRAMYQDQSDRDKARYEREMKIYKGKKGSPKNSQKEEPELDSSSSSDSSSGEEDFD